MSFFFKLMSVPMTVTVTKCQAVVDMSFMATDSKVIFFYPSGIFNYCDNRPFVIFYTLENLHTQT